MSTASWIAIFIAIFICIRRKRFCGGSPAVGLFVLLSVMMGIGLLFLIKENRITVARGPTSISIPTIPSLPRITTTRITAPPLRISAGVLPLASAGSTTQPDSQWIEDWSSFVAATHWRGFRAESSETCVTEDESRQQAIDDAATKLAQAAIADPSIADEHSRNSLLPALKTEISAHLLSGDYIADQFVRKIDKSYGTLYKTYLLIDMPGQAVASLQEFARQTQAQSKLRETTTWASMAALFLVITLLYAFLNAATKGYFVWKLRAAAMMIAIFALLAVFAWGM